MLMAKAVVECVRASPSHPETLKRRAKFLAKAKDILSAPNTMKPLQLTLFSEAVMTAIDGTVFSGTLPSDIFNKIPNVIDMISRYVATNSGDYAKRVSGMSIYYSLLYLRNCCIMSTRKQGVRTTNIGIIKWCFLCITRHR